MITTMKTLIFFLLLLLFTQPGCFTDSSVSPDFGYFAAKNQPDWLQLDEVNSFNLQKEVNVVQMIDGKSGGTINYNLKVANVDINGSLEIPKKSFNGDMEISALFSNQNTTQIFGPSPFIFNKTLVLTLEYSGVNLRNLNPATIDFYYIDNTGQFQKAEYSSITVDTENGILKVTDARINHFSRWGWAKVEDD
jgi:hypothetical protein